MRVLIAHASEASRTTLTDAVTRGRRLSLDIVTVDNGPDALDLLLADDPPEVALIDWDLPGIEAPELCRLVRDFHLPHDTWMIVMTPQAHRESAGEVWRAGADDCVFAPAPSKLLSERVTKGLCEMAPPVREAAAAAAVAAQAAAEPPAAASLQAVSTASHRLVAEVSEDAFEPGPASSTRPSLDAVSRPDDEVPFEAPADLDSDLRATVDPDDLDEPAKLAATPVQLAAQSSDPGDCDAAPRGSATLDAVLVTL